jgi:triacylglycerol lipase
MEDIIDSDIEAPGFSVRTAYFLAHASHCAYEEGEEWIDNLGLNDETAAFTCGEFHGFVGFLDTIAIVAFRGTKNIGNCLTDAETPLVARPPYPGQVHLGFADAVDAVWPEVCDLLGPPSHCPPLWVTGHSLGGAMATLASVRLTYAGYTVRAVYTYGSPRPGDQQFQKAYNLVNYRLVNDNDLVPHLPFRWCYKHVGELKLLDELGNLIEEQQIWRTKKKTLRRKAKGVQRAHRGVGMGGGRQERVDFDWLSDHYLHNYLGAIEKILPRVPRRRRWLRAGSMPRGVPIRSRRVDSDPPSPTPPDIDNAEQRKAG